MESNQNATREAVERARAYLDGARQRKIGTLSPTAMMRELAETRRQLGTMLGILDDNYLPVPVPESEQGRVAAELLAEVPESHGPPRSAGTTTRPGRSLPCSPPSMRARRSP